MPDPFTDYQRITNRMMDLLTEKTRINPYSSIYADLIRDFVDIIEDETYSKEVEE